MDRGRSYWEGEKKRSEDDDEVVGIVEWMDRCGDKKSRKSSARHQAYLGKGLLPTKFRSLSLIRFPELTVRGVPEREREKSEAR